MIFGINTTRDISKLLYVISRAVRWVKFEAILKYHKWYLCQISRTNETIICLFYYPQNFCNVGISNLAEIPLLWANQIAEISHVIV